MEQVLIIFQDIIRSALSAVTENTKYNAWLKMHVKTCEKINTENPFILTEIVLYFTDVSSNY